MKEIYLTQGKTTLVDDEDHDLLVQWLWYALEGKTTWYAARMIERGAPPLRMHNAIMKPGEGQYVDHIDWNGLNNVKINMRLVSQHQNILHRRAWGSSGYRGVTPSGDRWRATIKTPDGQVHLGSFDTAEEAARAYDERAKLLHGEFAQLNFNAE